jgi:Phage integrase, N-terminal SAM-like domain
MARPATGNVRTRKLANGDTRYALRFRVNGEPVFETLGTDAEGWTRKRAEEALKDRLAEVRLGSYIPPRPGRRNAPVPEGAESTFHEFASQWFAMREPELEPSTVDAIRWRLTYVLLPYFQHHRLSEITVAEVDRYKAAKVAERDALAAARAAGEKIDRRPLSNSTINRTIGLLAQILDVAVEYGQLPANPARGKRRKLKAARPQRPYLDSARRSSRCWTPRPSWTVARGPTGSTSTGGRSSPRWCSPGSGSPSCSRSAGGPWTLPGAGSAWGSPRRTRVSAR